MSFPNACYRKTRDLRIRGVPEMSYCMVYTPSDPAIYTLNASAWLILSLCDGRSGNAIANAYHAAVEPALTPEESSREVRIGLEGLLQQRLIEVKQRAARKSSHERGKSK